MAWIEKDYTAAGDYLMIVLSGGVYLDLTGTLTEDKVLERLRPSVRGWSVTSVVWNKGILGIGDKLVIYGRATSATPTAEIRLNCAAALNSFWEVAGASARVYVSDGQTVTMPNPPASLAEEWSGTLQLMALAVIAVAVVYGIKQVKEL